MIAEDSALPHLTSDSTISSNSPCCKTWWPPLACPGLPFRSISLDLHRPYSGFHTMHMQCERDWQKMSRVFANNFSKRRYQHHETQRHISIQILLYLLS